tara:strand:+ start:1370 stop:1567 length:198 start_codon:yes stop_codon:yes gene_type:complete
MPRTTSSADKLFEVDVVDDEDVSIALLLHTKEASSFLFSINLVLRLKDEEDEHVREENLMTVWFF